MSCVSVSCLLFTAGCGLLGLNKFHIEVPVSLQKGPSELGGGGGSETYQEGGWGVGSVSLKLQLRLLLTDYVSQDLLGLL